MQPATSGPPVVQISSQISALPSAGSGVTKLSSLDGRLRVGSRLSSTHGDNVVQVTSSSSMNPVPTRLRLRTESGYGMPVSPYLSDARGRLRTESTFGMLQSPYIASQWTGATPPVATGHQIVAPSAGTAPGGYVMPAVQHTAVAAPVHGQVASHLQLSSLLSPAGATGGYMQYPPQHMYTAPRVHYPAPQPVVYPQQGRGGPNRVVVKKVQHPPAQRAGGSNVVVTSLDVPKTTVMLRNLPTGFSRDLLMRLLDTEGFAGTYDFAYLPFDFQTLSPLTHAFVNFPLAADAERCREHFEGFTRWPEPSDAVGAVAWNDRQQGLPSLVERYRNSPVMHESVPEECKPVIIIGGQRAVFPAPTVSLKAPKIKAK